MIKYYKLPSHQYNMGQYFYFYDENGAENKYGISSNFGLPWAARYVEDTDFVEVAKNNKWSSGKITAKGDSGDCFTYMYNARPPKRAAAIAARDKIRTIIQN
jgi:hypothetical protein